ncbi:ligand-binding sensor domain-containing diguanylate cyclase [Granulicella tundricola]|nr:ligand-binding sensor domain-containing diguanylate cyclase [Granulicella tundricola]
MYWPQFAPDVAIQGPSALIIRSEHSAPGDTRLCRLLTFVALLAFLLATPSRPAAAQQSSFLSSQNLERIADLEFDTLNTKDGLPHQSIYSFTQDTAGYIWIATYGGLSRFDGYQLRSYTHDPAQPTSLRDNNVRVLLPAPNGDLWIGSDADGVFYYRASTDSFEDLPDAPAALKGLRVYCLISDGHGGIWAGGQFGLFHFNPNATNAAERYETFPSFAPGSTSSFTLKRVFSLFLDSHGALWVGGDPGVVMRPAGSSTFQPILGIDGEHEIGPRPYVWSFLEDHSGRLWVGCDHVGIAIYDSQSHSLRGVPGLSGAISEIGEHTVRGLIEPSPGEIWIATYGGGLVTYDTQDGFIRSFVKNSPSPAPLHNNFMRGIFKDSSGVVWMGTDNGLARINDAAGGIFQIHPSLLHPTRFSGTDVRSVGVVNGQVWVGFDQGEFGPVDQDAHVLKIEPAPGLPPSLITRREILAIKATAPDTVYVGGTGLFRVDLKSHTYRPSLDPLIDQEIVGSLCPDGNTLWAGTYNGLYALDLTTGHSQIFRHDPSDPTSISENDVRDLLLTRDGRLWISTRAGLDLRDPATGRFRSFRHLPGNPATLPGDNVRALVEDSHGRLWIATTGNGLAVLNHWSPAGTPIFHTLDTSTGLLSNSVLTVTLGLDGRIWANTSAGLSVIDPNTLTVQTYTAGDGLRSTSEKLFGSVTLPDGTLLFRSADGLLAVQPSHLEQRTYRAPLVMTAFTTADSHQSPFILAWQSMHGAVSLDPRKRGFEADVALLDYTGPESTRYSYRLQGLENDGLPNSSASDTNNQIWTELPPGLHTITFSALPPGTFTLLVRAVSRSGQGPLVESAFTINAPRAWTETLPFRLLLVLLTLGIIYVFIRLRTRVLDHRREHLEQEIELRTLELSEKSRQLELANLKLGQLAIRDSLTNLYNRRHFLDLAEAEYLRSRRSQRTFSLLLMDIDHFKLVNDTWGHFTGDAVIQMVADRISSSLRATDTAARFGGEEYIVLLPETSSPQAIQLAERIREAVAASPLQTTAQDIAITLSIGCAEFDPNATLTQLLERADKALYAAKNAGRNRIEADDATRRNESKP